MSYTHYCIDTSPKPFEFITVLGDFFNLIACHDLVFCGGEIPLHPWTATGLAITWWWLMTGNQFMLVLDWMSLDDGWKLVSMATGTGYRMNRWVMGWYNVDVAGSPSPVGWCNVLPQKPKDHPNSPSIWNNINLETIISIVYHPKPLRLTFGTSMYYNWDLWCRINWLKCLNWLNYCNY